MEARFYSVICKAPLAGFGLKSKHTIESGAAYGTRTSARTNVSLHQ